MPAVIGRALGNEETRDFSLTRRLRLHLLQLLFGELLLPMTLAAAMVVHVMVLRLRRGRGRTLGRSRRRGRVRRDSDTDPAAQEHDGRASD
jgi:hypothetical protein